MDGKTKSRYEICSLANNNLSKLSYLNSMNRNQIYYE